MAKFDACIDLPNPSANQGVLKSANRFGCFYSAANPKPKTGAKSRTQIWTPILGISVFDFNKLRLRSIANAWRKTLTATQRSDWNAWATGTTIFSYDGGSRTPNGFEAFVKVIQSYNVIAFDPHAGFWNQWNPAVLSAPATAWVQLAAPNPNTPERYGGGAIGISVTNTPADTDVFMLGQIAKPGTPHARPGPWFMPWEPSQDLVPGDPDYLTFWQTDYPFYPPDTDANCELALQFFTGDKFHWGPYSFLSVR